MSYAQTKLESKTKPSCHSSLSAIIRITKASLGSSYIHSYQFFQSTMAFCTVFLNTRTPYFRGDTVTGSDLPDTETSHTAKCNTKTRLAIFVRLSVMT